MKGHRHGTALWILFVLLFSATHVPAQSFRIRERTADHYLIEFNLDSCRFFPAKSYLGPAETGVAPGSRVVTMPRGLLLPTSDGVLLPQTGFSLVLPPSAAVRWRIVSAEADTVPEITLAAVADSLIPPGASPSNPDLHGLIRDGGVQRYRGIPLHSFQLRPFRYNSKTGRLWIYRKITFRIDLQPAGFPSLPAQLKPRKGSPLARHVLNWRDIRWEPARGPVRKTLGGGKEFWYRSDRPYVKVMVTEDRIYRITGEDLSRLGLSLSGILPAGIQMLYKGKPYPVRIDDGGDGRMDPEDYVEFYGFRNPGVNQYYNDYSDTTVFWLTWGEENPARIPERSVSQRGGELMSVFYETEHREEDRIYHSGDYALAVFNTDRSPGEGWIWERIYAGDEPTFTVTAYNYPQSPLHPDSLRIKIHGITNDPVNPDHHLELWLNGTKIGDIVFDGVRDVVREFAIPAGVVHLGENTLKIRSPGDTGAQYDAVYLDWFELKHDRQFIANDDLLRFSCPPEGNRRLALYYVTNFHSDNIVLYDVSTLTRLVGFEVHPSGNRFFVVFSDSVRAGTRYLIAGAGAIRKPDRLELDRSSTLHDSTHQADYLIITHRSLWQQANELAEYRRQHNGVTPFVADVEDILDEFNYGLMDPLAIRDFIAYAVKHWRQPAPRFVLLFGDASWDFKKNGENSVKENLVPTYGNPVSDSRLVSIDGVGDFLPDLYVGRLPAESPAEAAEMVRKIKEYENQPHRPWQKNLIFLNGGFNDWEQNLFKTQSEEIIENYVEPPPFGGNPVRIYKESDGLLVGEHRSDIMNALDTGALWLSFLGHAGSETWDLMLQNEDIPELNNGGRLPFISSMTCHTARFANPVLTTFGELFLKVQGRGAVAFWGTTGWGYIFQDRVLLNELFKLVMKDSVWTLGEATTETKLYLWDLLGYSQINVSSIDQYTLLGDPLVRLAVPPKPDFSVSAADISVSPEEPSESDSLLQVKARFFNFGLVPEDSVRIAVSLSAPDNGITARVERTVPPPRYATSLQVALPLRGARGELSLQVQVDEDNRISELDETNNTAEKSVYVYSTSISLSKPLRDQVLTAARPVLQVYSPEVLAEPRAVYRFEVDTSRSFDSPALVRSEDVLETPVVTRWRVPQPLQPGHYFWRCRTEQSSGHSKWLVSSFWLAEGDSSSWKQDARTALSHGKNIHLRLKSDAAELAFDPDRRIFLEALSAGFNDGSDCKLVVNYSVQNQPGRGHHLIPLDFRTGKVLAPARRFDTYADTSAANAMADYIQSFPDSTVFLVGIMDEGSSAMTERAYRALESLGSQYCRSVGFRDSWALIGRKGAAPGTVPEAWVPRGGGAAVVRDTLRIYRYTRGDLISEPLGPAVAWKWLRWSLSLPAPDAAFELSVTAPGGSDGGAAEIARAATGGSLDLRAVDAGKFPRLQLRLRLQDADGLHTPVFRDWSAAFVPAPDLATHPALLRVQGDSLLEGKTVQLSALVLNVGLSASDSSLALFEIERNNEVWDTLGTAPVPPLPPDDSAQVAVRFSTAGYAGRHRFRVTLDAENKLVELSERNNQYSGFLFVRRDTLRPAVSVTFDGREILPGDLVRTRPVIRVDIQDNSPLAIADTGLVRLFLDSAPVYFGANEGKLELESRPGTDNHGAETLVTYRPELPGGDHVLEVFAKDASQNPTYAREEFRVVARFALQKVLNVPNPFAAETQFTYVLTQPAEKVTLKVFTLSGRPVFQSDDLPADVGFNAWRWDGRDKDGDALANGVYLYRLSALLQGKTVSKIGKFIIMR